MINEVVNVYKKKGETPLDCINKLKKERPELGFLPITYAGRLDPLAQGVLLLLVGDEVHKKDEYLKLGKVYEVEVLFGFATDTYDVLGKLSQSISKCSSSDFVLLVERTIPEFVGKIKQSYPPYSSRPVQGKSLFMWAREGRLNEIEIPTHQVLVENIEILEEKQISGKDLLEKIKIDISSVDGDFRQKEIINIWDKELSNKENETFPIIKLRISCGSGAYMRSIAHDIGQRLGVPALALSIIRTKVGEYIINS
jgi:tRNA pseudouridine55 synthase